MHNHHMFCATAFHRHFAVQHFIDIIAVHWHRNLGVNHIIEAFKFRTSCVARRVQVVGIKYRVRLDTHTCQFVIQIRNILFAARDNNRTEQHGICWHQFHFLYVATAQTRQHCVLFALGTGQEYCLFFGRQIFDFAVQIHVVFVQIAEFHTHFAEFRQPNVWHRIWITAFLDCSDAASDVRGFGKHFHTCNRT